MIPIEELGLRVAPGFHMALYADSDLANDIQAMTLDAQGRVVVTGPGYIKTLLDTDHDGKADRAELFANTRSGGMGLCFEGSNLYFVGDGGLSVYRDRNSDGQADGPPEHLLATTFSEHGGHALRQGPDGWWYFIGGNDAGFTGQPITLPSSPVRVPEAGALLRFSLDGKKSEIIAHGLRNPYDFDFNALGDIFTFDSDVESDFHLPWYTPTRVYHLGYGGHHGWRLGGWTRSWNRPDSYVDTVDILESLGRGSPTGVVCYRHTQFPQHYRDGLFVLDWTFGRIFFLPLKPDGASYRAEAELFLEPIGSQGFAPTDVAVAPDGSLFVSIGGRRTRGAVYRIWHGDERPKSSPRNPKPRTDESEELDPTAWQKVLQAPQPLEAWSRARWTPRARKIGAQPFRLAVVNDRLPPSERIRAIEVVTEMFGGLETARAMVAAQARSPQIRARVAWSVGRVPCENLEMVLTPLAKDGHPAVRCAALEAMTDRIGQLDAGEIGQLLPSSLGHPDKRLRQAAARLAARLPDDVWANLGERLEKAGIQAKLTALLAALWRADESSDRSRIVAQTASLLPQITDPKGRLQAVRLLMLALGDYHLHGPSSEVYTAYELPRPAPTDHALLNAARANLRESLPAGHDALDRETARLLAMLEDNDPALLHSIAGFLTESSPAAADFHYLIVFSRLPGERPIELTRQIAAAVRRLDPKLGESEFGQRKNWNLRLVELITQLIRHDPRLTEEWLQHPDFVAPGQIILTVAFDPPTRLRAAALFKSAVEHDSPFPWSGELVALLSALPAQEVYPLYREHWAQTELREPILIQLARRPDSLDRAKFLHVLEQARPEMLRVCLTALEQLPRDPRPTNLVPALRALRRLLSDPPQKELRAQTLALINRQADQDLRVHERGTDWAALRNAYEPVFAWFRRQHPSLATALVEPSAEKRRLDGPLLLFE